MPIDFKTTNGTIVFEISDADHIGFGTAASSSYSVTAGGYTLLDLLYNFAPQCFNSATVNSVVLSVATTPGTSASIGISSIITGGSSNSVAQPGLTLATNVDRYFAGSNAGGQSVALVQDTSNLYFYDTRSSGNSITTTARFL